MKSIQLVGRKDNHFVRTSPPRPTHVNASRFRGVGGVFGQAQYKENLKQVVTRRSSATVGRGVRNSSALIAFTKSFLQIMIDQIDSMAAPYDFGTLNVRLERQAKLKDMHDTAPKLL